MRRRADAAGGRHAGGRVAVSDEIDLGRQEVTRSLEDSQSISLFQQFARSDPPRGDGVYPFAAVAQAG